jgi:hypothetical protein
MTTARFQFQNARVSRTPRGGLPEAVKATMKEFQKVAAENLRRGEGSIVTSVTEPKEGAYFAVVLAGPFENVDTLQSALRDAVEQMPSHLQRIGLK